MDGLQTSLKIESAGRRLVRHPIKSPAPGNGKVCPVKGGFDFVGKEMERAL